MMKRRPPEVKREARDDAARGDARHAGAGAAPDDPRGAARRDPPPGSRAARGGATHPAARAAEPAAIGVLGWTIVAPTLAALALGRWLDRMFATRVFFSAPLLMLGAALGLWLAWRWMKAQQHGDRDD
ncbi:AtpZ/AtpI family protein [Burkholderia pseudomallei]|uniref:AtpZ/AtpI family protein n=1 Tax=Burkholderia pseudomallei TaxID=28450 RepID=UPI000F28A5EC|nr:AtpZ/AtpI family protein [Burkholderia pseudomallei]VBQ39819.1 putative ATP synthase subunit [Burkholderia pseudomallei]